MLLGPFRKPVLAMEREARFNLKSFLIKSRNHGGQTKSLCEACTRASHHVQTPPLTYPIISLHILTYPNISHHIPISQHIPPYPSISYHILAYSSISQHLPIYHSISQHILAYPSISNISHHIQAYPSISQYILRYSSISHHILTYPRISQRVPACLRISQHVLLHILAYPNISCYISQYPTISYRIPPFWSTGCNKTRKSQKMHSIYQEMLQIPSETPQKPCRSSPKRPTKPTT